MIRTVPAQKSKSQKWTPELLVVSATKENTVSTCYIQVLSENENKLSETEPIDSLAANSLGELVLRCPVHLHVGIALRGHYLEVEAETLSYKTPATDFLKDVLYVKILLIVFHSQISKWD